MPAEPNLASVHVYQFELDTRLQFGRAQVAALMADERIDTHEVLIFTNLYNLDGKQHYAAAIANPLPRRRDALALQIFFGTTPTLRFEHEKAKPVPYLLDLIEGAGVKGSVRCTANFSYPSRSWASFVKLPMDLLTFPAMPFDELRGFRAVKFADGRKTKYSIIVDRAENRDYHHSVAFSSDVLINSAMIDSLLREAVSISRQFIRAREPRGRKIK